MKSLSRGLNVLKLINESTENLRTTDIAAELGMDKSLASRILTTLVSTGFIVKTEQRKYKKNNILVSNESTPLLTVEKLFQIKTVVHQGLVNLQKRTGECVHSAALAGDVVWYIDKIESNHSLKIVQNIGTYSPLHCTALGKIFLSFEPLNIPVKQPRFTNKTLCTPDLLEQELVKTRNQGYAIDDEEYTDGVRCLSAPVYFNNRVVMAMGMSGPTIRMTKERQPILCEILKEEAEQCSINLSLSLGE